MSTFLVTGFIGLFCTTIKIKTVKGCVEFRANERGMHSIIRIEEVK